MSSPLPYGDLNKDGAPEVFVISTVDNYQASESRRVTTVRALSGKSGRRLWSMTNPDSRITNNARALLECCPDVNGDGRPDVFLSYALDDKLAGEQRRRLYWLGILSGRSGTILWQDEIAGTDSSSGPFRPQFADLDGDSLSDLTLVLPLFKTTNRDRSEYRLDARRGRDGSLLWSWLCGAYPSAWQRDDGRAEEYPDFPDPSWRLGDLDGDGKPEVVFWEEATATVCALDAANGQVRWRSPPLGCRVGRSMDICVADLQGDGRLSVAVACSLPAAAGSNPTEIAIFAVQDDSLQSRSSTIVQGEVECLRNYDLDGDNVEELVVVWVAALNDQSSRLLVRACRGDFDHLLWERPAAHDVGLPFAVIAHEPRSTSVDTRLAGRLFADTRLTELT